MVVAVLIVRGVHFTGISVTPWDGRLPPPRCPPEEVLGEGGVRMGRVREALRPRKGRGRPRDHREIYKQ